MSTTFAIEGTTVDPVTVDRVIVPLDGSVRSESALPTGLAIARRFDAELKLVMTTFSADDAEEARYLDRKAARLDYRLATAELLRDRFPTRGIVNTVTRSANPVVCMATHGRLGAGRLVLGSVAQEIVSATGAPTMLIGPRGAPAPRFEGPIVMGWDGSDDSTAMIAEAAGWAKALGLELVVVTVDDPDTTEGRMVGRLARERVTDRLHAGGVSAEALALDHDDPAHALTGLAASRSASLIAVATTGRSGLGPTAFGSVAMSIVHHSPCPVLIRRPPR